MKGARTAIFDTKCRGRREFLKSSLIGLAGLTLAAPCRSWASESKGKVNILLITSEDHCPQLGCYGDPYAKTPCLDKLAEEGIRFTNAHVTQAGCSPSRSSMLTGLYPHENGQIGLATHYLRMYRDDTPNLFSVLKSAGYRTGLIGKLHVDPESAFPRDFEERLGGFEHRNVRVEAATAEKFIKQDDKPFFLMVNYKDAHDPFIRQSDGLPEHPLGPDDIKPLPHFGLDSPLLRQQTADYYNCILRLDAGIGMLSEVLDRCGKRDNTLVIYLSDHGIDSLRGKRTCFQGGTKVPLIIRWPGQIKPGQVCEELVSAIDFMPTILSAAGVSAPEPLPGLTLQAAFDGAPKQWRQYLFTEFHLHSGHNFNPQRAVQDRRYKLILNLQSGEKNPGYTFTMTKKAPKDTDEALRQAPKNVQNAYERERVPPKYELYDLQNDPYEFDNLAENPEYKKEFERLRDELERWRKQSRDPLLNPKNLERLKAEVYSRWKDKDDMSTYKSKKGWMYPDYFFEQ